MVISEIKGHSGRDIKEHFFSIKTMREKCPNTELFLVRIFPHLDGIRRDRISPYSVQMRENTDQE